MSQLKYASLCSGYGGLDDAIMSVIGGELAWYAEFDKAPAAIMAHHHPGIPNLRDITAIDWAKCEPIDVMAAGFPCQPFSHAGKRLGANDPRHLWPFIAQGIKALRPSLVVLENVRGLLSGQGEADTPEIAAYAERVARINHVLKSRKARNADAHSPYAVRLASLRKRAVAELKRRRSVLTRAIGVVLRDLADLGYDARWYGLRAADVGAAHGRFRIFIFAQPADANLQGLEGLADQAGTAQAERHGHAESGTVGSALTLLPTPAVNDMGAAYTPETWDAWTARMKSAHGNGNGHGKSLAIEAQRLLPTPVSDNSRGLPSASTDYASLANEAARLFPTPTTTQRGTDANLDTREGARANLHNEVAKLLPTPSASQAGGTAEAHRERKRRSMGRTDPTCTDLGLLVADAQQDWREYAAAIARAEHATGRTAPPPTEPGTKGNPRLSPAFVEWLMMLPAGHVTDPTIGLTRNEQLKALGNGVVPAQAAAATRAFLADTRQEKAA